MGRALGRALGTPLAPGIGAGAGTKWQEKYVLATGVYTRQLKRTAVRRGAGAGVRGSRPELSSEAHDTQEC